MIPVIKLTERSNNCMIPVIELTVFNVIKIKVNKKKQNGECQYCE